MNRPRRQPQRQPPPPLLHQLAYGGRRAPDEWASSYILDGVAYCWTADRGLVPRPAGWASRGKVYVSFSPNDILAVQPKEPAA